jgi:hypothetical protein
MEAAMKKRGDPCNCIHRFLTAAGLHKTHYEDEVCIVRCADGFIVAYAYEAAYEGKRKVGECVMRFW